MCESIYLLVYYYIVLFIVVHVMWYMIDVRDMISILDLHILLIGNNLIVLLDAP